MRKIKNFNLFINENLNNSNKNNIKDILKSIFSLIKSKNELKKIWNNDELEKLNVATNIYNELIELEQISKLPYDELEKYANNLNITINNNYDDLLISIMKKKYENKYNNKITNDIDIIIENINNKLKDESYNNIYELLNLFLKRLEEIKNIL